MKQLLFLVLFLNAHNASSQFFYNAYKHFTYYKKPVIDSTSRYLNTEGVYYCRSIDADPSSRYKYKEMVFYNFIFLYSDGSIAITYNIGQREDLFKANPDKVLLEYYRSYSQRYSSWGWGRYYIRHDTVFSQFIDIEDINMKYPTKRYFVITDSGISFYRTVCKKCKDRFSDWHDKTEIVYDPPKAYKFYKTSIKPDSSYAWYKHRNWYIDWMEEHKH